MQHLKFGILGASIVGLIAAFLPFVDLGGGTISLIDFMSFPGAAGQVLMTLAGFIIGLVVSIIALKKGVARSLAITATVGFALSFIKLLDAFGEGAIGAKLLFVAALAGLALSIAKVAKPDDVGAA